MYTDEYGVQFSDDKKKLDYCPEDFKGEYIIPNGVETIGREAFADCVSMTKVYIPESVKQIESEAFSKCKKLIRVECNAICPPLCGNHVFDTIVKNATLYVPSGCIEEYRKARVWKQFRNILSLVSISSRTFSETIDATEKNETEISAPQVEEADIPQNLGDDPRLSLTINQFSASIQPLYPNNRRLLSYFDNGTSPISQVLNLSENQLKKTRNIGAEALKAWKEWCDQIRQELGLKPKPIQTTLDKIRARICAEMPIDAFFEKCPELYQKQYGKRLSDIFKEKGPSTILDLFLLQGVKKQKTKKYLLDLQAYILEHLDDLDVNYHTYLYDSIPHALPELNSSKEYTLYEKIQYAIQQLCARWLGKAISLDDDRTKRNVEIVRRYLKDNISMAQLAKDYHLKSQSISSIVNNFVDQFMRGVNSTLVKNYYIDPELIEEINAVPDDCLYKSSVDFWNRVAPAKSREREVDNIITSFFNIDFATPSQQDNAQFWDTNTCICVRDADKGNFKEQVLKPIYQFLQTKIEPVDIEVLQGVISDSGHEVASDTEYLKSVLKNYSKVIAASEDTYQLVIDAYSNGTYKCARYVYDHREENREFSHSELKEILHLGKTNKVPSNLDETLRQIVTLREGKWKYGSYNADVPYVPIRTLVAQYAENKGIFLLEDLCKYIKQNYQREQPALNTIYGYATRYCTVSSENNQLFCYFKALDRHPEFKRKERKEIGTINNYVLRQIHEMLLEHETGLKIDDIRKKLIVPRGENKAYYASRIPDLIRRFASEESIPSSTPFWYKEKGTDTLVVLSKNHEDFEWENIGKARTIQYRDTVLERIIQFLLQQKDFKCMRQDLYRECMPIFESVNLGTASTIFYDIIYHRLGDAISSGKENGEFYLWLSPEQRARITSEVVVDEENREDHYTLPERIPYPYGTRPAPKLNNFNERLTQHIRYINLKSNLGLKDKDIVKASQYITEMLFENENIQVFNDLLYGWNEYFNYQIDLRSARSIYASSLNAYEKYLRELYGIEPSCYNRIAGLADTVANIPDLCEEFGYEQIKRNYNRTPIQRIYNSFWLDRNNLDHGENLRYDERFVYTNIRQAIVLYVYAYLRHEQSL
jgi:predicted DNA-binding protein YlxM (UPF0122 family)